MINLCSWSPQDFRSMKNANVPTGSIGGRSIALALRRGQTTRRTEFAFNMAWKWFLHHNSSGIHWPAEVCKQIVESVRLQSMSPRYLCTIVDGFKVHHGQFKHTFSAKVPTRGFLLSNTFYIDLCQALPIFSTNVCRVSHMVGAIGRWSQPTRKAEMGQTLMTTPENKQCQLKHCRCRVERQRPSGRCVCCF